MNIFKGVLGFHSSVWSG